MILILVVLTIVSGSSTPKHVVGAHSGSKPWLEYTKKWTGGKCNFNLKIRELIINKLSKRISPMK